MSGRRADTAKAKKGFSSEPPDRSRQPRAEIEFAQFDLMRRKVLHLIMPGKDLKKTFEKYVEKAFPKLSQQARDKIIAVAMDQHDREIGREEFMGHSARQPKTPMKWSERPTGMKLVEFLEMEYRDKKRIGADTTLKSIRDFDKPLAQAISDYWRSADLPNDLPIRKSRDRKNRRELTAGQREP